MTYQASKGERELYDIQVSILIFNVITIRNEHQNLQFTYIVLRYNIERSNCTKPRGDRD